MPYTIPMWLSQDGYNMHLSFEKPHLEEFEGSARQLYVTNDENMLDINDIAGNIPLLNLLAKEDAIIVMVSISLPDDQEKICECTKVVRLRDLAEEQQAQIDRLIKTNDELRAELITARGGE
ncbi:hypothetical protein Dalk_4608 [Desulfatibacillum aliphaticivorans]|uniref:Uncharacterized protein n=1 Tax=Desulfatibacillum aliphaticivorans TaxID=218208 RepID=B8FNK5_DESAL|nr:hypothetical protein [Desulfatibacillum aliphaticivorans]ACL06286.1 hypothetical protein Dalk_4608 [Desulfatibacillum aliphaticivorans]